MEKKEMLLEVLKLDGGRKFQVNIAWRFPTARDEQPCKPDEHCLI